MQKKKPLFHTVTIVGVGLIGGSLGLAIRKNKLAKRVIGVGHRRASLQKAIKKGAIDLGTVNLSSGVKAADLVILATPVSLILRFLGKIPGDLKPGALVIDVGSSKEKIVKRGETVLPKGNFFIGCHPIAGSEKRGIEIATATLFNKTVSIVTPSGETDRRALKKIKVFWQKIGSKVEIISPAKHDRLMATVSHLPHLAAVGLILKLAQENKRKVDLFKVIGPGFKDTTRIAASSPISLIIWIKQKNCGLHYRGIFLKAG